MDKSSDKKTTFGLDEAQIGRLLQLASDPAPESSTDKQANSEKSSSTSENRSSLTPAESPQIKGYDILAKLGEAGQGQVWRALQLSTGREVALKVPRIGSLVSDRTRMRFEREVELAARLKHPRIARLLDSGIHQGQYYYVMDLIEGANLDQYVQSKNLGQTVILKLMVDICQAVQHAHQKGIIHRDLKPSNIIVTEDGVPYLVDFGLAKEILQEDRAPDVSLDGETLGTPAYMSPEQATGHAEQVDTRTDVYSLGVILFHLLTGQLPHDLSGSRYDVLKRIAEGEKKRPRQVNPRLDKDLEILLLKALDSEPDRRYTSAGELAQDIDNYLQGNPLLALPATHIYHVKTFVRRHKTLVASVCAILIVSVIGTIVSVIFAAGQARARTEAQEASQRAERAANESKQAAGREAAARAEAERANAEAQAITVFLTDEVLTAAEQVKGRDATVIDILNIATVKLEEGMFDNQPLVEASVRLRLANVYDNLGYEKAAIPHRERVCQLSREGYTIRPRLGYTMNSLACSYHRAGEYKKAELLFKELIERQMGLHNWYRSNLAMTYVQQGRYKEAQEIFLELMNIPWWENKIAAGHPYLVNYVVGLAETYQAQGRYSEAEQTFTRAFELALNLRPGLPLVRNKSKLAEMYVELGRYSEAYELFHAAIDLGQRELPGKGHPDTLHAMNGLAVLRTKQRDYDEAEHLFREAWEGRKEKLGDEHPDTLESKNDLAILYKEQGDYEIAEPLLLEAIAGRRLKLGDTHPHTIESLNNLIALYEAWNKPEQAAHWRAELPSSGH